MITQSHQLLIARGIISLLLCFVCASSVSAARHVMIVSVRAGNQQQADINREYCIQTKQLFESAEFDRILLYCEGASISNSQEATASAVLEGLKLEAATLSPEDEFWLVLYGYMSKSSRGITLATKGKRLTGAQLAEALDGIQAPQCIVALNQGSAALMPLLATQSNRRILTAASSEGQLNPPQLPKHLWTTWRTNLTADCSIVFEEAAKLTEAAYKEQNLAIAEVSQFFNGHEIDVYPFEQAMSSSPGWSLLHSSTPTASERKTIAAETQSSTVAEQKPKPGRIDFSAFEDLRIAAETKDRKHATAATLKLMDEARQQALEHTGFPAFYTRLHQRLMVNRDESSVLEKQAQIYLLDDVASETYGRITLTDYPPHHAIEIKQARIIYPDGSYLEPEPKTVNNPDHHKRYHSLKFPGAKAGCLIELTLAETEQADSALRDVNQALSLQKSIPVASARFTLEHPKSRKVFCKLYGSKAQPETSTGEYSVKRIFELGALPALEQLPYDPPLNNFAIRLAASSLESWDSFREWVDQILEGSDALDEPAKEKALEVTRLAKTDAEKVKALYEFLCDLRYETTPVGARAFRPRLPGEVCSTLYGDCKDKANALVSMARFVGVPGCMALVNRASTTDESFPSWQFNHAVAYFPNLPEFPDGLWCDATDGATPFASLPPGDIGRSALVLEEGKTVFKTIQLPAEVQNKLEQNWELTVGPNGTVTGIIHFKAHGLSDYTLRQSLKRCSPKQLKYRAQHMVNLYATGLSVESASTSALTDLSIPLEVTVRCSGPNWTLVRTTLTAPYNLWDAAAVEQRERELMLNDGQPLTHTQTILVQGDPILPSDMNWEQTTDVASMNVTFEALADAWQRRASIDLNQPRIPSELYSCFQEQIIDWNTALRHHLTEKGQGAE